MTLLATEWGSASARTRWIRGLWDYYRRYTHSAVHAASAAALTAFGLLIYIDRLFVVVAIASYVCPPIVLYTLGIDVGADSNPPEGGTARADSGTNAADSSDTDTDTDSDGDDGDSDSDGTDTDSDGDDSDADADGSDADTDG